MLPQEITSLGPKRELVIIENVPPILANRILYYKDPAFMDRLKEVSPRLRSLGAKLPSKHQLDSAIHSGELAAPVPLINMETHHHLVGGHDAPVTVAVPNSSGAQEVTIERPMTNDDMPNLAKLGLADFVVDFSAVEKPKAGDVDEAALHAYADRLCIEAGIKL